MNPPPDDTSPPPKWYISAPVHSVAPPHKKNRIQKVHSHSNKVNRHQIMNADARCLVISRLKDHFQNGKNGKTDGKSLYHCKIIASFNKRCRNGRGGGGGRHDPIVGTFRQGWGASRPFPRPNAQKGWPTCLLTPPPRPKHYVGPFKTRWPSWARRTQKGHRVLKGPSIGLRRPMEALCQP